MKIFIINLLKSVKRRTSMVQMMKKLKLNFTLFEAVDGHALLERDLAKLVKYDHPKRRALSPGEIGCFLSHYNIYKKIVDEKIPYALILEDDVQLSPRFPGLLKLVEAEIKQGDVISFYVSVPESCQFSKESMIDESYFYIKPYPEELVLGAVAYLITHDAAQQLVKNILPINNFVDDWRTWVRDNLIKDFKIVFPHPVDLSDVYSDIEEPYGNFKLQFKKTILNKDLPFISQYILKRRKRRRYKDRYKRIFIDGENPEKLYL